MEHNDFNVKSIGKPGIKSPIKQGEREHAPLYRFVEDTERVLVDVTLGTFNQALETGIAPFSFEKAGPRENIFFERIIKVV